MQFAHLNNITLHFADNGPQDAQPIVFANSLGTDFRIWDDVITALQSAHENKFRFITYDKRGHGLSDAPLAPYKMDDHIDDLVALLEHLNIDQAIMVGLSVGGMIAQGIATRSPERIKAVVLSDTGHKIGDEEIWNERISSIRKTGMASISTGVMERWFSKNFHQNHKVQMSLFKNMLERTPLEGYLGTCAALRDCDLTQSTANLTLPVLAIVGSEDVATTPQLMQQTCDLIKGSRLEIIDGVGHLPCIEKPETTAQLIAEFLTENSFV